MVTQEQSSIKQVTSKMINEMTSGSVIFDMAASPTGGNVDYSQPNEVVTTFNGVKIIGYTDLPSRVASSSSSAYANNIADFLLSVGHNSRIDRRNVFFPTVSDPVVKAMMVVDRGTIVDGNPKTVTKPVDFDIPHKSAPPLSVERPKVVLPVLKSNDKSIERKEVVQVSTPAIIKLISS